MPRRRDSELARAARLIDASYAELTDRPRCAVCGKPFTPRFPSQTTCRDKTSKCALVRLTQREQDRAHAGPSDGQTDPPSPPQEDTPCDTDEVSPP